MRELPAEGAVYDSWADYYDVTDVDRAPCIAFYVSLMHPAIRSVLEVGCGTGTVITALATRQPSRVSSARQILAAGIDQSTRMLLNARRKTRDIAWITGDMRQLPVCGRFDLVVCCFNTLQLLLTDDDLASAFSGVRRILSSGGRFAFDIYQPNLDYLASPTVNRVARELSLADGRRLEVIENATYEPESRVLTIDWRLIDAGCREARPLAHIRHRLRQYFRDDIDRLLRRSGLAVHERYGGLDRSPFTALSKKQVLICGAE